MTTTLNSLKDIPSLPQMAQMVREARARKKYGLGELASLTGLSVPTISYLERGQRFPSLRTARLIGAALDIDITAAAYEREHPQHLARRREVLNFVRAHVARCFYPPTLRQVMDGCGIGSTAQARYYIIALIQEGALVELRGGSAVHWYHVPEAVEAVRAIRWE